MVLDQVSPCLDPEYKRVLVSVSGSEDERQCRRECLDPESSTSPLFCCRGPQLRSNPSPSPRDRCRFTERGRLCQYSCLLVWGPIFPPFGHPFLWQNSRFLLFQIHKGLHPGG